MQSAERHCRAWSRQGRQRRRSTSYRALEGVEEPLDEWLKLPAEYRGKGAPGAMAWGGTGKLVESAGIWRGELKPGAVLQLWKVARDYKRVRDGDPPGTAVIRSSSCHTRAADRESFGVKIADQGFISGKG